LIKSLLAEVIYNQICMSLMLMKHEFHNYNANRGLQIKGAHPKKPHVFLMYNHQGLSCWQGAGGQGASAIL
jgi:hypothetical protein